MNIEEGKIIEMLEAQYATDGVELYQPDADGTWRVCFRHCSPLRHVSTGYMLVETIKRANAQIKKLTEAVANAERILNGGQK